MQCKLKAQNIQARSSSRFNWFSSPSVGVHDELLDGVLDRKSAIVGRRLPGQLAAVAVDVGHQEPVLRCRRPTHNRQHDLSAGKESLHEPGPDPINKIKLKVLHYAGIQPITSVT